ncbi:MAG: type I-E CRISPR-associated protein Cse1/CasA [Proteobacteria bacterium]|nr:MAG: type I-E CRISPR-associated protein Cse1/CasA [Pseudomonadota bacterium]
MNLINDAWIPIRRSDGTCERIAPWQLTETNNPVISLDAPRADFNGALMQFLIGLLQTASPPEDEDDWVNQLEEPPLPDELKKRFLQYSEAFELAGQQGAFMQDFDALDGSSVSSIAELLIESPGGNTVKENKDHFVKRGGVEVMCPACVATALFTLQINAPSGGQGHRTSLRGGGPLSTLVVLDENNDLPNDLWRNLWLNVLDQPSLEALSGNQKKVAHADIFPWLASTRTSEKTGGTVTTPVDVSPLQMYWGMPRRIRINWDAVQQGRCDICDAYSEHLVSEYRTKNYGINYTGAWQHPLSPYTLNKSGDLLPQHAQPGGMTYQHWLKVAINDAGNEPHYFNALVVKRYQASGWKEQLRLYVFGYDMDNMKARCWYEATFPLFIIADDMRQQFSAGIQSMTEAATEFAGMLRSCVKDAWFSHLTSTKGDITFLSQSFYHHTEAAFFTAAKHLQTTLQQGETDKDTLHQWHKTLLHNSLALFDYWADSADISQANPRRIVAAREKLCRLAYSSKIKQTLKLPKNTKKLVSKPKQERV